MTRVKAAPGIVAMKGGSLSCATKTRPPPHRATNSHKHIEVSRHQERTSRLTSIPHRAHAIFASERPKAVSANTVPSQAAHRKILRSFSLLRRLLSHAEYNDQGHCALQ